MRSRRLTSKGASTRARILAAATELMCRHGVGCTSLDAIGETSGAGRSQIYHYFRNKDELVEQVVHAQIENVISRQRALLEQVATLRGLERWRDAVLADAELQRGFYGCPMGMPAGELTDRSDASRRAVDEGFAVWERLLREGIQRIQRSGELSPESEPADLATAVLASLHGGYLLAQARRDPDCVRIALDMALAHVRAQARPGRAEVATTDP